MAPSTSGLSLSPLKAAFTGSNPVGVTISREQTQYRNIAFFSYFFALWNAFFEASKFDSVRVCSPSIAKFRR